MFIAIISVYCIHFGVKSKHNSTSQIIVVENYVDKIILLTCHWVIEMKSMCFWNIIKYIIWEYTNSAHRNDIITNSITLKCHEQCFFQFYRSYLPVFFVLLLDIIDPVAIDVWTLTRFNFREIYFYLLIADVACLDENTATIYMKERTSKESHH